MFEMFHLNSFSSPLVARLADKPKTCLKLCPELSFGSDESPADPSVLLLSLVPPQHKIKRAEEDLFKEYQQQLGTEIKQQNETEIEICPLRFYCWLV